MDEDNRDVENDGDRTFSFVMPSGLGAEGKGVRMRVCRLVASDLSIREGAELATRACQLAYMATEVVRGRLPDRILDRLVTEEAIEKLLRMASLLREHTHDNVLYRHLPAIPTYLYGTVINHDCFDVCVGLTIGYADYRVSLVMRRNGGRWVCTVLDFG